MRLRKSFSKAHEFHHFLGSVLTKSCLIFLSWKPTCLESSLSSVGTLYKFYYIWKCYILKMAITFSLLPMRHLFMDQNSTDLANNDISWSAYTSNYQLRWLVEDGDAPSRIFFHIPHINMMSWYGNASCIIGPLWGESTSHLWIHLTKGQLCKKLWCFVWC